MSTERERKLEALILVQDVTIAVMEVHLTKRPTYLCDQIAAARDGYREVMGEDSVIIARHTDPAVNRKNALVVILQSLTFEELDEVLGEVCCTWSVSRDDVQTTTLTPEYTLPVPRLNHST